MISKQENKLDIKPTSTARGMLYRVIARFRKNAENADDPKTRSMFEYAADVLTNLVRLFKEHEESTENQHTEK